jgi:hypothetical protein
MKWGDTQSFFQLTTALNLAYFSFGDMVVPSMRKIRGEIAALDAHVDRARTVTGGPTKYTELVAAAKRAYGELQDYIEQCMVELETIHRWAALPAFALGVIAFSALSWSTFHASHRIPMWLLAPLYIICMAPTGWYIGLNVYAKSVLDRVNLNKPLKAIDAAADE